MSNQAASKPVHSYGQILKSSSIIGGAQGINYLIGMVRVKLVAILLGPSGVGLVGLYMSATGLVGTFAGLGIDTSGVREVAEAHGSGAAEQVARTVKTLRRACWITGLLGWLLTAALSYPLSVWTFGSGERAWAIAVLGVTLLFGTISSGQSSVIQGTRRIGDLARMNVLGAVAGTFIAIGLYAWLGQRGIVPVFIATAATNLGFSWWFARKIPVAPITLTWRETLDNSKRLVRIGIAFMYGSLLTALVALAIRALIVRRLGLDAGGIYQAAWGISGMFAGFILNAMGADFYPRLTEVARDDDHVNRLVNEQTEIGILLALPGLLGTMAFAPWCMHIFYSAKFLSGAELLPWFVVGVFGQVISWPFGMIQMAKGATGWIYLSKTHGSLVNLGLTFLLIHTSGIVGVAWAFALYVFLQGALAFLIARRLSHFRWNGKVIRLVATASVFIVMSFCLSNWITGWWWVCDTALLVGLAGFISLRGIADRMGATHRHIQFASGLPGLGILFRPSSASSTVGVPTDKIP